MPEPRKFELEIDGEKKEVVLPDSLLTRQEVEEGFLPKASFASQLQARVERATKGMVKREDLLTDEEFVSEVATKHGDRLRELLDIKAPTNADELKALREQVTAEVRTREVKPLEEGMDSAVKQIHRFREKTLHAEVTDAAVALGVHPDNIPLLQTWYEKRVAWSDEYEGRWFIKGKGADAGEEFKLAVHPSEDNIPYMTILEDLEALRKSGTRDAWFTGEVKRGADYKGPGGPKGQQSLDERIAAAEAKGPEGKAELNKLRVEKAKAASGRG